VSLGRLVFLIGVALAVVLPVRAFVIEPIVIASPSMEPTLPTGARAWTDKVTLHFRQVRRGEVIVFAPQEEGDKELVKRVIGLPGDVIEIRDKKVFINGKPFEDDYAIHKREGERLQGDNLGPLTVPERHLFVLGDNRDESRDSSVWKDPFLPQSKVRGLVRSFY
jgi:signal peptidase I